MSIIDVEPDHYVLICAREYVETLRKLRTAANADERRSHTRILHYLMESGLSEQDLEHRRRERHLPADIQDHIDKRRMLPANRLINADEAELMRHTYSVLPFATMENLSGEDMLNLADLYEGWAQDGRLEDFEMARLLGRVDGFRALVVAIGADYEPPAKAAGEPDSLLKFLATWMKQQSA